MQTFAFVIVLLIRMKYKNDQNRIKLIGPGGIAKTVFERTGARIIIIYSPGSGFGDTGI